MDTSLNTESKPSPHNFVGGGKKGRIEWLDVLRGLAMYLVVIGHATEEGTPDSYRFYIYSFHMPLFFMISGAAYYLQVRSRIYSFTEMAANKARTLLWPYLTLNFIAFWIWILNFRILSQSETPLIEKIQATFYSNEEYLSAVSNATWFLTVLFLTALAFFLLKKWSGEDEKILILSVAAAGAFGYAMSLDKEAADLPWHLDTVPMALVSFLIGYLCIRHLDVFEKALGGRKRQAFIFAISLVIGYLCAKNNVKISMSANDYGSFLLYMGSSLGFGISCMLISMWMPKFKILKFIGRNTIVYLAFHAPAFRFLEEYSDKTNALITEHPLWVGTAVFILLIPVAWIFDRYLGVLLGRKKKKAERSMA